MAGSKASWARWALVAALVAPVTGCVAAAAAGAGAGTGIYLTSRGAESTVNGSVTDVAARTRSVLDAEGITITETKNQAEGDERSVQGHQGRSRYHGRSQAGKPDHDQGRGVGAEEPRGVGQGLREGAAEQDRQGRVASAARRHRSRSAAARASPIRAGPT